MPPRGLPLLLVGLTLVTAGCLESGWALPGRDEAPAAEPLDVRLIVPEDARVGEEVTFRVEVTGRPAGELFQFWTFGDGTDARGSDLSTVTHAYAEGGLYAVEVLVLDGNGREGRARAEVPVNQVFEFEGTVSSGRAVAVSESSFSAAIPVGAGVANATAAVALDRGEPVDELAGVVPGTSRATIRFVLPGNSDAGGDDVIAERTVDVPPEGVEMELVAPGDAFHTEGDLAFEVVAEEGNAHFVSTVHVTYG